MELEQGNTLERSILGAADHCEGTGSCVEQRDRGWVLIGQLIAIGGRLCGRRCKCATEYSSIAKIADGAPVVELLPSETPGPYCAKYALAVMDMETCDQCAQFDGVAVKLDDARRLPDHACTSERGCQYQRVFIRKEEGRPAE